MSQQSGVGAALRRMSASLIGGFILLLLLVVGIASNSVLLGVAAIAVAVGLTLLVAIGPERMGYGLLLLGMLLAPMNAISLVGNVTMADIAMVLGFGLLLPRLLERRPTLPPLYVIGCAILFTGGVVSSLLAVNPTASIFAFFRIVAAVMILPVVFNMLRPSGKLLNSLAWAYVGGQIISTLYSLAKGASVQGRSIGLTTQPNFYGLGGQFAFALLVFLFYRVEPGRRWIVLGAMAPVLYGVLDSGSRASFVCCALVVVMWPVVERSALAWYWILSLGAVMVVSAEGILRALGQTTTLDRLTGNTSAQYSDEARRMLLSSGLKIFWKHPVQGSGWDGVLAYHNVYLEVAIGGGVITLFGFLLILGALVRPLFNRPHPERLAFAAVSYAAFGFLGPTLYDRIVWAALALIFVTYEHAGEKDPEPGSAQDKDQTAAVATGGRRATKVMTPRRPRSG